VGALILLDDEIRVEVQEERTRGLDRWERRIEPLGHIRNTTAAAFGVYGIGRVSRSERIAETGRTLLEALLFTEGIDAAAKGVFGRKEPGEGTRASDFFAGSSFFPSGHTARAFAFATVLAERHGRPAAVPAYGLAGLVGLSRIERDVHWASDVLAGAALGHVAARAIVERRAGREKPPRRVELHPALSFDGNRFELRLAFRRADPSASEDWR
jgi:membrane-associated phospholipid phosphatase